MTRRNAITIGGLALVMVLSHAAAPADAQAPAKPAAAAQPASPKLGGKKPSEGGWTTPRTPEGKPDLQGTWSNATLTPLERTGKEPLIISEEEAARIENRTQEYRAFRDQKSDPNRPAPSVGGDDRLSPPGEPTFIERISANAGGRVGGYNNFWLEPGDTVLRIDGKPRGSIVVDPPDGRVPAMTAEARKAAAERAAAGKKFGEFDHPEIRGLAERCLMSFGSNAGPPMLPNYFYNNNYQIVQTKDHVMILVEMVHDARIIRIGGERLPKHIRPWMGDSIGRWEGDTLIVETTNFHPLQVFRGASENLRVTERFSRTGPDTISYKFTVEDPTVFTAPWSGELVFNNFNETIYEYACHEGNYALSNILSGERDRERRETKKEQQQQ